MMNKNNASIMEYGLLLADVHNLSCSLKGRINLELKIVSVRISRKQVYRIKI
jgi:hypothetical protein